MLNFIKVFFKKFFFKGYIFIINKQSLWWLQVCLILWRSHLPCTNLMHCHVLIVTIGQHFLAGVSEYTNAPWKITRCVSSEQNSNLLITFIFEKLETPSIWLPCLCHLNWIINSLTFKEWIMLSLLLFSRNVNPSLSPSLKNLKRKIFQMSSGNCTANLWEC